MAMDPVSSADRLVVILRQRLQERAKASEGGRAADKGRLSARTSDGVRGIHALAAAEGASERQLRRRFLQNILADEFGAELINEAQFQQVVERVCDTIDGDPRASAMLSRVIAGLSAS
ncbi:MAG: hypothetical protein H7X93_14485 [Sphingomonadaceae bacterium]|nr:hypothetical protein [Sphingomonadaceae bacterium]